MADLRPVCAVEGLLEDAEGEDDLVHDGAVVRVDGEGRAGPGLPRHRRPQLGQQLAGRGRPAPVRQQRQGEAGVLPGVPVQAVQLALRCSGVGDQY